MDKTLDQIKAALEMFLPVYFDRKGNKIDLDRYCELFMDNSYKILKQDRIGNFLVSTVWLGLDHSYLRMTQPEKFHLPLIFETMIFDGNDNAVEDFQERYSTEEEAFLGHQRARVVAEEKWKRLLETQNGTQPSSLSSIRI